MKALNNNWEEYVRFKISKNKFAPHIGLEFTELKPGFVKAHLPFQPIHEQQNGFLHGGVSSAILDMVCGFASYSLVEQEQQVFTVETKCVYYNKGAGQMFFAEGRVDKAGKRFHFCEGEIYYFEDHKKITVAKCTTTMAVV